MIYKKDYSVIAFILSLLGLLISGFFDFNIGLYLFAVITFAGFDSIGYHYVLTREEKLEKNSVSFDEANQGYRIVQTTIQVIISYYLLSHNWLLALLFNLTWWFGACDLLFYLLLKQYDFINNNNMPWLWWTVFGILNNKSKHKNTGLELLLYSLISVVLSIALIVLIIK